jgi:hypothetical protein
LRRRWVPHAPVLLSKVAGKNRQVGNHANVSQMRVARVSHIQTV